MGSSNDGSLRCERMNKYLNLSPHNDTHLWSLSEEHQDLDINIKNSLPWKLDTVCNLKKNETSCYDVEYHDKMITVCANATSDPVITDYGRTYVNEKVEKEWTVPIDSEKSDHFDSKQKCHRQKLLDVDNVEITSWVDKNDEVTCNMIMEDVSFYDDVERLFESQNTQRYQCILDTSHISQMNSSIDGEYKFVRKINFPCKDQGWKCYGEDITNYTGGKECTINDDCHRNVEFGICDSTTKVCKVGGTKGSSCSTHEDCDILQYASGECVDNKCVKGASNIEVSYLKPKDCEHFEESEDKKYQFCGETEEGTYTGYCDYPRSKDNTKIRTFKTCRPFLNYKEIEDVMKDEQDFQNGSIFTRNTNFHTNKPIWERLSLCTNIQNIDGEIVCLSTMEEVQTRLSTVVAENIDKANSLCAKKYPDLTVRATSYF